MVTVHFSLTVIASVFSLIELKTTATVLRVIDMVNGRSRGASIAEFILTTFTEHEKRSPLEVEEGNEHDGESNVNCDD